MPDPATDVSADQLIEILERQQDLVDQLDGLAQGQLALIDAGASDDLLRLLGDRQAIMDELAAGQDGLNGLVAALRGREDVADGQRERISQLVEEIGDRLTRIVSRDEQDRARLQTTRERTAQEISGLHTARKAQHAYVNARTRSNRFADRQG
ncbi:MAG: flagellar export chaperone FlgN [Planctomycetota bacterium]|jgi:hypothetical protein